jgi:hypothetical protein
MSEFAMFVCGFGVRLRLFVLADIMVMCSLVMMVCGCVVISCGLMMVFTCWVL